MKMMTKRMLIVASIILLSSLAGWSQCSDSTKADVDKLKAAIPYPKFNMGDVVYIAFITNPKADSRHLSESDVDVYEVRIEGMRLINGLGGPDLEHGLYLEYIEDSDSFPIEWEYQYVENTNKDPVSGDLSKFYSEDRFFSNPISAKQQMIKRKR